MAELVLKVGTVAPDPAYQDGDVLHAFNLGRIRRCHAEHICHPWKAERNGSRLITLASVCRNWYEATHQYRFDRVSATEIDRVAMPDGTRERLTGPEHDVTIDEVTTHVTFQEVESGSGRDALLYVVMKSGKVGDIRPDGLYVDGVRVDAMVRQTNSEAMFVRDYIERRKREPLPILFGEDGREIWYGGAIDVSHAKLDIVWNAIETKTPHRESSFTRWPAGSQELKSHLFVAVDEMTDAEVEELQSSEVDDSDPDNPVMTQKRLNKIDWTVKLGLSAADIAKVLDKNQSHDHREVVEFKRSLVVDKKIKKPKQ